MAIASGITKIEAVVSTAVAMIMRIQEAGKSIGLRARDLKKHENLYSTLRLPTEIAEVARFYRSVFVIGSEI